MKTFGITDNKNHTPSRSILQKKMYKFKTQKKKKNPEMYTK